jgi:hypothetical protein
MSLGRKEPAEAILIVGVANAIFSCARCVEKSSWMSNGRFGREPCAQSDPFNGILLPSEDVPSACPQVLSSRCRMSCRVWIAPPVESPRKNVGNGIFHPKVEWI